MCFFRFVHEFSECFDILFMFSNIFGRFQTYSDAFGCVRMCSDAFGCIRTRSEVTSFNSLNPDCRMLSLTRTDGRRLFRDFSRFFVFFSEIAIFLFFRRNRDFLFFLWNRDFLGVFLREIACFRVKSCFFRVKSRFRVYNKVVQYLAF
jgi:hypothetical protein